MPLESALTLCLALHAGALMAWTGGLFLRYLPGLAIFQPSAVAMRQAGRLALATALAWPLLQAAVVYDDPGAMVDGGRLLELFGQTHFGHVWLARLVMLALAVALSRASTPLAAIAERALTIAALASLALVGHAAAVDGAAGWLQRGVLALHLLAAAAWVGALPVLWHTARELPPAQLADGLRRFSAVGIGLVALVLASGATSAWWRTGSLGALVDGDYGRLLATKVGLVALMGVVALRNRNHYTPALAATATPRATEGLRAGLRRSLAAESALGGAVVLLAAFLAAAEAAH